MVLVQLIHQIHQEESLDIKKIKLKEVIARPQGGDRSRAQGEIQ